MKEINYLSTLWKNLLLAFMVGFLAISCVGTVEEGLNKETQYRDPDVDGFEYRGIIHARPIAHNKIELEFEPIFDEAEYQYFLHVNEDTPIKLSLESLKDGQIGYLKYTLMNLNPNTSYKLRVSVEKNSGEKSSRENEVIVTTFDNVVADFSGITAVTPIPGQSHSSVNVAWVPSTISGSLDLGYFDVNFYEVTYIPKTTGLQYINTPGAPGREVVRVRVNSPSQNPSSTSTIGNITNLSPDTSYYFQVRAIHKIYEDQRKANEQNGTPITVNREENTNWIEYRTSAATGVYDFNAASVQVRNAEGIKGLSEVSVFWQPATGIFHSYRVFYRKYRQPEDGTNPTLDDKMSKEEIQDWMDAVPPQANFNTGGVHHGWVNVDSSATNVNINGLERYQWYQFKVVPCRTVDCKVDPASDGDSSIMSQMVPIRVEPTLAPFYGISFVNNPMNPAKPDEITLDFDPPVLSVGYANKLRVYCLDPSMSNFVAFPDDKSPITSSGESPSVGNCDGLAYQETININTTKRITITGVKNINNYPEEQASYCFAMTPAIIGTGFETKEMDRSAWVVRCIAPEIKTPTLEEFPGLSNNKCDVLRDTAKVQWNAPSGGIYNKYRVFLFRRDSGQEKFEFSNVTKLANLENGAPKFVNVTKNSTEFEHTFTDLEAGKTYFVGVLAFAEGNPGYSDDIYSEFNLNFLECKIPYPVASFKEWTRVFAIGPKIDGRVPLDSPNAGFLENAYIYEALNSEGIPYEVSKTGSYADGFAVNTSAGNNYSPAPGFGATLSFTAGFDGKPSVNGLAASRSGVVSLAWKDVELNFKDAAFKTAQDQNAVRASRTFGYRVYRSSDNKANWELLTTNTESGLIHAGEYRYRVRSNAPLISGDEARMAFFTDYSVSNFSSIGDNLEIDRARVYWYKIVPVYEGIELSFSDSSSQNPHNIIKVTLPPANMALVHRMMANRNICTEMDKAINKSDNYSCEYNGVGAIARTAPWRTSETIYDFKHDMLVDRFELGCNFTRGSNTANPQNENSWFNPPQTAIQLRTELKDFKGFATDSGGQNDTSKIFRGCTQGPLRIGERVLSSHLVDISNLSDDYDVSQFDSLMYGDCVYNNTLTLPYNQCSNPMMATSWRINYPQLVRANFYEENGPDCSNINVNGPSFLNGDNATAPGILDEGFINHITLQAEHGAVIWNRNYDTSHMISPYGPNGKMASELGDNGVVQNCFINLAAIGAEPPTGNPEWKSRWIPVNMLDQIKTSRGRPYDPKDTMASLHNEVESYTAGNSAAEYRVPPSSMWDAKRFNEESKVGRVFSSNSSKLPPLVGFSRQDANRLCETYEVEVGFGKDETSYQRISSPQKKRLLRRQEFVVASAHTDGEDMTEAKVTAIESRENSVANNYGAGACVANNRIASSPLLNLETETDRRFATNKALRNSSSSTYLWTGSSIFDSLNDTASSELCTSRYGIQDLIGNLSEVTSDALYCDYRQNALMFGEEGNPGASIILDGYLDNSTFSTYRRRYPRNGNYYFWEDTQIVNEEGEVIVSDPVPWINPAPLSGYCSLVDRDKDRIANPLNFRDEGGIFRSITNFSGNVNTSLLNLVNNVDIKAVDSARSGDGYYLNWGPENLLPPIGEVRHSMALNLRGVSDTTSVEEKKGKFFNPVLGLPLSCSNTNTDTCGSNASDNKKITTSFLFNSDVIDYQLTDFPTHNSQILHDAIGTSTPSQRTLTLNPSVGGYQNYVIMTKVVVNATDASNLNRLDNGDVDVTTGTMSVQSMISSPDFPSVVTNGTLNILRTEFDIIRHAPLQFLNGGNFSDGISGRYGMRLDSEGGDHNGNPTRSTEWYQKQSGGAFLKGVRCGVKLGEN